jgi:hypothetical protein
MLALRSSALSWTLVGCAAIAPLACAKPAVPPAAAAPAGHVPPGGDAGIKRAAGPSGSPAGSADANDGQAGAADGAAGPDGASAPGPTQGGQACAMEVHQAERVPVDLLLLVETSSSMEQRVSGDARSKGQLVRDALTSFIKDPGSAGLGVGLQLFPGTVRATPPGTMASCQSDMDCGPDLVCRVPVECLAGRQASGRPCPQEQVMGPSRGCPGADGMCVDAARCSVSQAPCYPPGQRCPGGKAGDLCQPAPRRCLAPPGGRICQPSTYEKPAVPITALPGGEAPLLEALAQDLDHSSGTPMGPAVAGALAHAQARRAANPTHHVALVLAGDGLAALCEPRDGAGIAALVAAAATGPAPVSTYAVGVFASNLELRQGGTLLEKVATAGGTGKPFVLNADPNLAGTFLEALEKIRQASLPCAFVIPRPNGPIDFGKVNVDLQNAAGTPERIAHVTAVDRCDPMQGGWYYDVDPAAGRPTTVVTCPATCDRLEAAPSANVSLVFGCKTPGNGAGVP